MYRGSGRAGRCHQRGGVVNLKAFLGEALGSALELGIGTPDDVMRHVSPDVLAACLPRPLWARLFTASLGAPRVDAQLVVETIGVPNLCEHVPTHIIWACVSEIAARSLGQSYTAPAIMTRASLSTPSGTGSSPSIAVTAQPSPPFGVLAPPPATIEHATATPASGPALPPVNTPLADLITELESDDRPITPTRSRTPTGQRFRQSNTGIGAGRLGTTPPQPRRPQAQAIPPATPVSTSRPRRTGTDVEEPESEATSTEWRGNGASREIAVDDSQLVDWQSTETTQAAGATDDDFSDLGRKR
jgi:hypothetical protein